MGKIFLNSPSWARTSDLAVNSRSLYQLSYRGIADEKLHVFSKSISFKIGISYYPNLQNFVKIQVFGQIL